MHRTSIHHRRRIALALVLAAGAAPAAAPGAWAQPADPPVPQGTHWPVQQAQDQRSPDSRDAAIRSLRQEQRATQAAAVDLRSPDARDAAAGRPSVDLRSPDARDAAAGRPKSGPQVSIVRIAQPSGFDWTDAGIGAGAAFAMTMIAAAGGLLTTRRRSLAH